MQPTVRHSKIMVSGDGTGIVSQAGGPPARSPGQRPDVRHPRPLTPAELIGQYGLECVPVRDLLVSYLRERHLAADYSTLRTIGAS